MMIRTLRLERGWSQAQLAEFAGLSLRTIQRIEKGQPPTLESRKSLAAVFEVDLKDLDAEGGEIDESALHPEEADELDHIRRTKRFAYDAAAAVGLCALLFVADWAFDGQITFARWAALGTAIWLTCDAFALFSGRDLLGRGWERRQLEKRIGRRVK